jgi:hypothetical protein
MFLSRGLAKRTINSACYRQLAGVKCITKSTKFRLLGGVVLIFNLWLIGHYNLAGIPALLLTFGFAVGFEYLVVRPSSSKEKGAGK